MPKHISRLVLLLVVVAVVALGAIRLLTVDSFYRYGHYRGNSVAEIAAETPNYRGTEFCASCHAELAAAWSKGSHNQTDAGKTVRCETCHGAAAARHGPGATPAPATALEHPRNLKMTVVKDVRQLCTLCHEKLAGRPSEQPQIVVAEHAGTQQCTVCHDAHTPKIAAPPTARVGDAEAGKAKSTACAGCHGTQGPGGGPIGPSLAGQNATYLLEALKAYATGGRENPVMGAATEGLSEGDAENLAAYYAGLRCESTLTAERQGSVDGRQKVAQCVGCHGANGMSNNSAWPNLVNQSKQRLVDSLKAYRSGARKNAMMSAIVSRLSEDDLDSAAAYYANASCK